MVEHTREGDRLPLAQVGAVIVAWSVWAWRPDAGWAVALACLPLLASALQRAGRLKPQHPDLFLALFLITAAVGLWAGYDRSGAHAVFSNPIGWQKFWGLLLAALLFYTLARIENAAAQRRMLALFAGMGAAVAVVFAATHNWADEPSEWAVITALGLAIQKLLPALPYGLLNANVTAGILALLLPLSLGLTLEAREEAQPLRRWLAVWGAATATLIVLALVLTSSQGAWLGLASGLALLAPWWLAGRLAPRHRAMAFAGLLLLAGIAAALALAVLPPLRRALLESASLADRRAIFSQAALLARDYPFTGCGLGNFPLVHSTYALMIHVPILSHAHALLLDIAVEQGVPGSVAALLVWGAAAASGVRTLKQQAEPRPLLIAGLISLVILFVHGLVDDTLYATRGVLLLWAPAGIVLMSSAPTARRPPARALARCLGIVCAGGLALGLIWGRDLLAAWYANLGAVAQSQAELPAYDFNHFDRPGLDAIRRQADLATAEARFAQALALDPGQATARTRLAQLALSRGAYDEALRHARAAWEAGHRDRVTRLTYGDALVAQGQVDAAAEVVRGLPWIESRLNGQAWYRYRAGEEWQRAVYAWETVLLLDPGNEYALEWIGPARERLP